MSHPSWGMILLGTRVVAQSPRPWLALAKLWPLSCSCLVVCSRWMNILAEEKLLGKREKVGKQLRHLPFYLLSYWRETSPVAASFHLQVGISWGSICAIAPVTGAANAASWCNTSTAQQPLPLMLLLPFAAAPCVPDVMPSHARSPPLASLFPGPVPAEMCKVSEEMCSRQHIMAVGFLGPCHGFVQLLSQLCWLHLTWFLLTTS